MGGTMALFTLLCGAVMLWRVWDWVFNSGWNGLRTADVMILIGFAGLSMFTLFGLGLAVRKPIGLRIDHDGISGYFAPTLKWCEIAALEPRTIHKGTGIHISLKDPKRQALQHSKAMRVLNFVGVYPKHSFINTTHLGVDPEELIAQMETLRYAAALDC